MTARLLPTSPLRFSLLVTLAAAALSLTAADARAACFTSPPQARVVSPRLQAQPTATTQAAERLADSHLIVGMWAAEFYANTPTGPKLWNQGFELFHADGTELSVDNAVPPVLGNVCVGVWKSIAPRTIRLRHMTWNWNPDGTPAGTFLLLVTATVGHDGSTFEGTFVSDSFDLSGNPIPDLHAEGTVRATRITVD